MENGVKNSTFFFFFFGACALLALTNEYWKVDDVYFGERGGAASIGQQRSVRVRINRKREGERDRDRPSERERERKKTKELSSKTNNLLVRMPKTMPRTRSKRSGGIRRYSEMKFSKGKTTSCWQKHIR